MVYHKHRVQVGEAIFKLRDPAARLPGPWRKSTILPTRLKIAKSVDIETIVLEDGSVAARVAHPPHPSEGDRGDRRN
jgi:hypothetical protein